MRVPLVFKPLAADITHAVSTEADELVAAFGFDEAEVALRTRALYGVCGGALEREAEGGELGGEAGVRVVPGGAARDAGCAGAGWREALEAQAAALEVDAAEGGLERGEEREWGGEEAV